MTKDSDPVTRTEIPVLSEPATPTLLPAPRRNLLLGAGLAMLFATMAFFSGLQVGAESKMEASIGSIFAVEPSAPEELDLTEFWRVWEILDDKFVAASSSTEPLTDQEKLYGAIDGLVELYGDPYTVFLPPEDATAFEEDIQGNFGGVGMEVGIRDGAVSVIAPLADTPAERAGILAGDVVVKIDDVSTADMNISEAVKLIRGEIGTEVRLTIVRAGEAEFLEISVTRDRITIPTVETELRDGVFIISLYSFNALSEDKMKDALVEFTRSDTDKLILDLRGNPGGFLQSAITISSHFLPAGKVVVRENSGADTDERLYRSFGQTIRNLDPEEMVILIDGGSASASEIVAGALSQHNVATLIGQTTFGKGSVQELVDLRDGSSLKVTIARWLTPNGTSISDGGLEPDVVVERTPEQFLNDEDPQLDAALDFLNRN